LLGNIGRPGLTLLTCPQHPDRQDKEQGDWRQCGTTYNGAKEDMFRHTTLHLSLTEWSSPLWGNNVVGERDSNGIHVEAVVSVRDSGHWIADIDPLRSLRNHHVTKLPSQEACPHPTALQKRPLPQMQAIETWDQVLDCEEGLMVVKSHKNWIARLAVVCVLSHHCRLRHKRIVICPEAVCWECVNLTENLNQNIIFVY